MAGYLKPGSVNDQMISTVDLTTVLSLAGIQVPTHMQVAVLSR